MVTIFLYISSINSMLIFKKIFICVTILISWVLWRIYMLQDYEIDKLKLRCKEQNVSFNI